MSTLDDDLTDVVGAPGRPAARADARLRDGADVRPRDSADVRPQDGATAGVPRGLVDVLCLGCERRFATDAGMCPWCGRGSTVAVVPPPLTEPARPAPSPRPARAPLSPALIAGVAVTVVALGLAGWVLAGRRSGTADRSAPVRSVAPSVATSAAPVSATTTTTATSASIAATTTASATTAAVADDATARAAIGIVAAYVTAITERDWARARTLVPSVRASDADYATLYGATRSVRALALATTPGDGPGTSFVHAGQVVVEARDGALASRLVCARYGVDRVAGTITSVRTTALATVPGEVTADAVRDRLQTCPTS